MIGLMGTLRALGACYGNGPFFGILICDTSLRYQAGLSSSVPLKLYLADRWLGVAGRRGCFLQCAGHAGHASRVQTPYFLHPGAASEACRYVRFVVCFDGCSDKEAG